MFEKKSATRVLVFVAFVGLLLVGVSFVFLKDGFSMGGPKTKPAAELQFDLANYLQYSPSALQNSQTRGQSLLFFAATGWCQSCSKLEEEIVARAAEIPSAVTILKVDYDNDKEMNRKHAVTMQHTLVLFDSDGTEVTRWVGGDFDEVLRRLRDK